MIGLVVFVIIILGVIWVWRDITDHSYQMIEQVRLQDMMDRSVDMLVMSSGYPTYWYETLDVNPISISSIGLRSGSGISEAKVNRLAQLNESHYEIVAQLLGISKPYEIYIAYYRYDNGFSDIPHSAFGIQSPNATHVAVHNTIVPVHTNGVGKIEVKIWREQ